VLLIVMPVLKRYRMWLEKPASQRIGGRLLLTVPIAWLFAVRLWLAPHFPETHALFGDWTVHAESLPLFLLGYASAVHPWLWTRVERLRWITLAMALLAITVELSLRWLSLHPYPDRLPDWGTQAQWHSVEIFARATYTWMALLTIFGWSRVLLNRPFRWLAYCTEAVFSWYMLHQTLIIVLAYYLIPLRLGSTVEPLLVAGGTVAGCLLLHEFLIRRIAWLRPLFGLKTNS
jgi:hypothetical protein